MGTPVRGLTCITCGHTTSQKFRARSSRRVKRTGSYGNWSEVHWDTSGSWRWAVPYKGGEAFHPPQQHKTPQKPGVETSCCRKNSERKRYGGRGKEDSSFFGMERPGAVPKSGEPPTLKRHWLNRGPEGDDNARHREQSPLRTVGSRHAPHEGLKRRAISAPQKKEPCPGTIEAKGT